MLRVSSITPKLLSNNRLKSCESEVQCMVEPRPAKPSNLWMSIVSGINRYLQKLEALKRSSSCILDWSARSNVNRCPRPSSWIRQRAIVASFSPNRLGKSLFSTSPEADWASVGWAKLSWSLMTGDRKKGQHTDYVKRQYIGNLGIENGIVAVTAYGLINIGSFAVWGLQTKNDLNQDSYRKPEIAAGMMRDLKAMGFRFSLVLDSFVWESGSVLNVFSSQFCSGDSQQSCSLLPRKQTVRHNRWRKFERVFSDGKTELRYIRNYFLVSVALSNSGSWRLTQRPCQRMERGIWMRIFPISNIIKLYGLRALGRIRLGSKNELGWADFHELCPDWAMVGDSDECISAGGCTQLVHQPQPTSTQPAAQPQAIALKLVQHPDWNQASEQVLNNLRLVIQPSVILNLLQPWLNLFQFRDYQQGWVFNRADESLFPSSLPCHEPYPDFYFSSA